MKMMMKMETFNVRECKECGLKARSKEELLLFRTDKRCKHGVQPICKDCYNKKRRAEYTGSIPLTATQQTNKNAMARYGISGDEYNKCMSTSDVCEICGSTEKLCYDHDHITGEFRGVLCSKCNRHIGGLGDSYDGVKRALRYLKPKEVVHSIELPYFITLGKKRHSCNLNQYRQSHYRVTNALKKEFKEIIMDNVIDLPVMTKIKVHYIIHYESARKFDIDNIISVVSKFSLDALTELGRIPDDNFDHVVQITGTVGEINKANPHIEMRIKEI